MKLTNYSGVIFLTLLISMATSYATSVSIAEISFQPISRFKIGSDISQFGRFTFVGGFSMKSTNRSFGSISSFRFLDDKGKRFAAVADTGFFIVGEIVRDSGLKPAGIQPLILKQLNGLGGRASSSKMDLDAEALLIDGESVVISFERRHRIKRFLFDGKTLGDAKETLNFLIPEKELEPNLGFETLAKAPEDSSLKGAIIAISEGSLDRSGNIFASVLSGPKKGIFYVGRNDGFGITDGAFLPSGDLILLERSFDILHGIRMRLRRIAANEIAPMAIVTGEIILQANSYYEIDNMESLDIWQSPDGNTRICLFSDNNNSSFQRNIYLEFIFNERSKSEIEVK